MLSNLVARLASSGPLPRVTPRYLRGVIERWQRIVEWLPWKRGLAAGKLKLSHKFDGPPIGQHHQLAVASQSKKLPTKMNQGSCLCGGVIFTFEDSANHTRVSTPLLPVFEANDNPGHLPLHSLSESVWFSFQYQYHCGRSMILRERHAKVIIYKSR